MLLAERARAINSGRSSRSTARPLRPPRRDSSHRLARSLGWRTCSSCRRPTRGDRGQVPAGQSGAGRAAACEQRGAFGAPAPLRAGDRAAEPGLPVLLGRAAPQWRARVRTDGHRAGADLVAGDLPAQVRLPDLRGGRGAGACAGRGCSRMACRWRPSEPT